MSEDVLNKLHQERQKKLRLAALIDFRDWIADQRYDKLKDINSAHNKKSERKKKKTQQKLRFKISKNPRIRNLQTCLALQRYIIHSLPYKQLSKEQQKEIRKMFTGVIKKNTITNAKNIRKNAILSDLATGILTVASMYPESSFVAAAKNVANMLLAKASQSTQQTTHESKQTNPSSIQTNDKHPFPLKASSLQTLKPDFKTDLDNEDLASKDEKNIDEDLEHDQDEIPEISDEEIEQICDEIIDDIADGILAGNKEIEEICDQIGVACGDLDEIIDTEFEEQEYEQPNASNQDENNLENVRKKAAGILGEAIHENHIDNSNNQSLPKTEENTKKSTDISR